MNKKLFFSLFFSVCLPTMHSTKDIPTRTHQQPKKCGILAKTFCWAMALGTVAFIYFVEDPERHDVVVVSYNPKWDSWLPIQTNQLQNNKSYSFSSLSFFELVPLGDKAIQEFEKNYNNDVVYNKDIFRYYNHNQKELKFIVDEITMQYGFKFDGLTIPQEDAMQCEHPLEDFFKNKIEKLPVITETGEKTTLDQVLSEEEIKKLFSLSIDSLVETGSSIASECEQDKNFINKYVKTHISEHIQKLNAHELSFTTGNKNDEANKDQQHFAKEESEQINRINKIIDEEKKEL